MDRGEENLTGYEPRCANVSGGRYRPLVFDGDDNNYELWEVKCPQTSEMNGFKRNTVATKQNIDKGKK